MTDVSIKIYFESTFQFTNIDNIIVNLKAYTFFYCIVKYGQCLPFTNFTYLDLRLLVPKTSTIILDAFITKIKENNKDYFKDFVKKYQEP